MSRQRINNPHFTDRLRVWKKGASSRYRDIYGGERAGTPKGDPIPFSDQKIAAAFALLDYGNPMLNKLSDIARKVNVSEGLLRIWRTEERFRLLFRCLVWEVANEFIAFVIDEKPEQDDIINSFDNFGIAVQQAIVYRVWPTLQNMKEWPSQAPKQIKTELQLILPPPDHLPRLVRNEEMFLVATFSAIVFMGLGQLHGRTAAGRQQMKAFGTFILLRMATNAIARAVDLINKGNVSEGVTVLEYMQHQLMSTEWENVRGVGNVVLKRNVSKK